MSAPYQASGQPATRPRRGHPGRGRIGPLVLIALGVVLLLQNAGLLPAEVWTTVGRLWPVVLILAGVELLLGGRLRTAGLAVSLVVVAIALALALGRLVDQPGGPSGAQTVVQARQGADRAEITVRFGAGHLSLGPLDGSRDGQLASMTLQGPRGLRPEQQWRVTNGVGQLAYQVRGPMSWPWPLPWLRGNGDQAPRMALAVSPDIPVALQVQTGAADARLDLRQLRVTDLDVSVGASTASVVLPAAAGYTRAHVAGGFTELSLDIPTGVAAQIRYRGGLDTLSVDEARFPAAGDGLYRSSDYDTAANRVDLTIDAGMASVRVR